MNALEAKALREHFAMLVAGDPVGTQDGTRRPLDIVLGSTEGSVNVDDVATKLGGLDRNRVAHHLLARGFVQSEADPNVFERRPWYSHPWPTLDESTERPIHTGAPVAR